MFGTRCRALLFAAALALALPWGTHSTAAQARHAGVAATLVAFTQAGNVYLMDASGAHRIQLTADAGGSTAYPWYAWSSGGTYLMVIRRRLSGTSSFQDILLFNPDGSLRRALVTGAPAFFHFYPQWAIDGDQIAYVSAVNGWNIAVDRVDVGGNSVALWHFRLIRECGGAGINPAERLYEGEKRGILGTSVLQWSISRRFALFSVGCDYTGLEVADLRAGTVQPFQKSGIWGDGVLSPDGSQLVAVQFSADGLRQRVAAFSLGSQAPSWQVDGADLPVWAHDGRTLYFTRRVPGSVLPFKQGNYALNVPTYRSAIYTVQSDGHGQMQLLTWQDAYGFGKSSEVGEKEGACGV